ncbi:MAG TPA: glycosyl hydrolase family 18 protein [Chloroflexia bacterium]|nr:glycosyl hydrolase family 18 protein [Chloroflexia bacterium]
MPKTIRLSHYIVVLLIVAIGCLGLLSLRPTQVTQVEAAPPSVQRGPVRWAYYVPTANSLASLRAYADSLTVISPFYFVLKADGTISGNDQPEVTQLAHSHGVKVIPMLQNDQFSAGKEALHNLLVDPARVRQIIDAIDSQVYANGYDGYHIDFENVLAEDRPYLTQFMGALYARLKPKGKLVTMAVAARSRDVTSGWGGSYDYAGLAPYLDNVVIMAYDYSYAGGLDGPVAPINWVNSVAAYAASQFGPGKVLLGVPFYGYDWNLSQGGLAKAYGYDGTLDVIKRNNGTAGYDELYQQAYADYTSNGDSHRIWYETPRGLGAKLNVVKRNNLGGFAAWRLGQEGADFWPVIKAFQ